MLRRLLRSNGIMGLMALVLGLSAVLVPYNLVKRSAANLGLKAKKTDAEMLVGRPWIDDMPEQWGDRFQVYNFTDHPMDDDSDELYAQFMGGTLAKYVTVSASYRACPVHMEIKWIADKQTTKSRYTIVKEKNGEFDLKMTIEADPWSGGRSRVYYSKEEWGDSESFEADDLLLKIKIR